MNTTNADRYKYLNRKRREYNLIRGIPNRLPTTEAQAHLNRLRTTMGWAHIATESGCSACYLQKIAAGRVPRINRVTHNKIMAVRPAENRDGGFYIDAIGSVRRVRALMAIAHPQQAIANVAGTTQYRISLLANGQSRMRQKLADKITYAYSQLAHQPGSSIRSRKIAETRCWAPPAAWDDDIDDPAAWPDWTGHCGTDRGWWLHRVWSLPTCHLCDQAHEEWKRDHAHLSKKSLLAALALARAAAVSRRKDKVDDTRELQALGQSIDVIAERLGVTRMSLKREMLRHPNPTTHEEKAS